MTTTPTTAANPVLPFSGTSNPVAGLMVHWWRSRMPLGQPWLTWPGSLTRALGKSTGVPVQIRVLEQGPGALHWLECIDLGVAPGSLGHHREVQLLQAGTPVICARSVTPASHSSMVRLLQGLGSQPLARLLFPARGESRSRSQLRSTGVRFGRVEHPGGRDHPALSARRTRWHGPVGTLLVSEVFLPAAPSQTPIAPR